MLGKGMSLCGASGGLWRGMGGEVGGECIAQPAGVGRRCVGERKCSGRACRCAGRAKAFDGEWVVRSAEFNALSPQQHARTRIIIYTSAAPPP